MNRILRKMAGATLLVALALSVGCVRQRTRTVLVPPGEPVQLAAPTKAFIYFETKDGKRIRSEHTVTLPEGWWCLPDPDDE